MSGPATPPGQTGADAAPAERSARAERPLSIRDFLTDGSLTALCAELTAMTGVDVHLRDEQGRRIVPVPEAADSKARWAIADSEHPVPPGATVIPLLVDGTHIGDMTVGPEAPDLGPDARERLDRLVRLLADAASELCHDVLELRDRVREMGVLYRLSSLLAGGTGVDQLLTIALESALDALALDAGSLVLLPKDADGVTASDSEAGLILSASVNLSRAWLDNPLPLGRDRIFDRLALSGEVVVVEDLSADDRVLIPERCEQEGLRSFICAGLVARGRPIGVIRLYAREPRGFTTPESRLLRTIGQQAATAVERARLLEFEAEERRIQRQLELARDVQARMLPSALPGLPGLDIAARCVPSFELGGDFYDAFDVGGHLGVLVGDVVGKGIAAALLMSAVRASLRAHVEDVYDLDEVMARVNRAMCRDTRAHEFATVWYGVLDPQRLILTYCSAGHDPPFVVSRPGGRAPGPADVRELAIGGLVVGIDPKQSYDRHVTPLAKGDVLVAYTDGLADARNFDGEKFGRWRLKRAVLDVLNQEPDAPAARVIEAVQWDMRRFAGLARQTDDETIVVVKVS